IPPPAPGKFVRDMLVPPRFSSLRASRCYGDVVGHVGNPTWEFVVQVDHVLANRRRCEEQEEAFKDVLVISGRQAEHVVSREREGRERAQDSIASKSLMGTPSTSAAMLVIASTPA